MDNLGLVKPVVGGSRSTWGALLNTIIDTINAAFGDVEVITDNTGTVILTQTQQNKRSLKATGTGAGGITIQVLQERGKDWLVINDRVSGSVTVRTGVAGAAVVVPLGARYLVQSDGDDCYVVQGAYDQDLNTTDSVEFDAVTTHNLNVDNRITIAATAAIGNTFGMAGEVSINLIDAGGLLDDYWLVKGGWVLGLPTGGNKGGGTINATAVYDDNVLLTDLVLDMAVTGTFDVSAYAKHPIASEIESWWFDIEAYSDFWREHRHLPGMISWLDEKDRPSAGVIITRLTAVVETMAVHIAQLNDRIKQLEERA